MCTESWGKLQEKGNNLKSPMSQCPANVFSSPCHWVPACWSHFPTLWSGSEPYSRNNWEKSHLWSTPRNTHCCVPQGSAHSAVWDVSGLESGSVFLVSLWNSSPVSPPFSSASQISHHVLLVPVKVLKITPWKAKLGSSLLGEDCS